PARGGCPRPARVASAVGPTLPPPLLRRVRPAWVSGGGLGLAAVGLGVLTQVGGSTSADLAILAGASLLVSLGLAPGFTPPTHLILRPAPPARAAGTPG